MNLTILLYNKILQSEASLECGYYAANSLPTQPRSPGTVKVPDLLRRVRADDHPGHLFRLLAGNAGVALLAATTPRHSSSAGRVEVLTEGI